MRSFGARWITGSPIRVIMGFSLNPCDAEYCRLPCLGIVLMADKVLMLEMWS